MSLGSWCGFWFCLQVVVLFCDVIQLLLALALETDRLSFCGARSRSPRAPDMHLCGPLRL